MKLRTLHIRNIGPFKEASLDFLSDSVEKAEQTQPVTIITGMNGVGKSIVIDAIRAAFSGGKVLERDIVANEEDFLIEMELEYDGSLHQVSTYTARGMNLCIQ